MEVSDKAARKGFKVWPTPLQLIETALETYMRTRIQALNGQSIFREDVVRKIALET